MYCPKVHDLQWDYNEGGGILMDQGWEITDSARASTKASFNLLGGYVEFVMDVSGAHPGVNTNVYSSFPNLTEKGYRGPEDYCDGQGPNVASPYWCLEEDFIEANGDMLFSSTWHTVPAGTMVNGSHGCDHHGCGVEHHFIASGKSCNRSASTPEPVIDSSRPFRLRASFSESGKMTIMLSQDDQTLELADSFQHWDKSVPGEAEYAIVKSYMENQGAVILSSQWTGWVPGHDCPLGEKGANATNGSKFTIHDLTLLGTVRQGIATKCETSTTKKGGEEMSATQRLSAWLIPLTFLTRMILQACEVI